MKKIFKFVIFVCIIFQLPGLGYCASSETQSVVLNLNNGDSLISLFTDAVQNNNTEIIKTLIDKGVEVNYRNSRKVSWLSSVCKFGFYDMAKVLIEHGARMDLADDYGMTPIVFASWYGHNEIVKLLIDKGADVNAKTVDGTSALMFAASAGNIEVMKLLLEKSAEIEVRNKNGINAVMEAMTSNQTTAVELLKSSGANITLAEEMVSLIKNCGTNINAKDRHGLTWLAKAAHENDFVKVKFLIDHGADPCGRDHNRNTISNNYMLFDKAAIYYASALNNETIVKLLVEKGATPDKIDEKNNPVLPAASKNGNYSLVKYLIDKKFSVNGYFKGDFGTNELLTPLFSALENVKIMELLIKSGADVNQKVLNYYSENLTPLTISIKRRQYLAFELLIKHGAGNINRRELDDIITCSDIFLYKSNLSVKFWTRSLFVSEISNAMFAAAEAGDVKIIKRLRELGANIGQKDHRGYTWLMIALGSANLEAIKHFIENGIDVNAVSTDGEKITAILAAANTCKKSEIIKLLIDKGVSVNQCSGKGWTPLMYAVRNNSIDVVKTLIDNGADVNAINSDTLSVLDLAEMDPVTMEIIILLKKHGARNNASMWKFQEVKYNAR